MLDDGGFVYSSDSYADDLPYWVKGPNGPHVIVPYTLDNNDMRFINPQGFATGDDFFTYLRDAFDVLYAEGKDKPKMMSVGLHCRLAGRPGRASGLMRFLDHLAEPRPRLGRDAARHRPPLAERACRARRQRAGGDMSAVTLDQLNAYPPPHFVGALGRHLRAFALGGRSRRRQASVRIPGRAA